MDRFLKIGLTGGIGSGKSLALGFIGQKGVPVLQTDIIGHELLKQARFKERIVKKFGGDYLGKDGELDRRRLSREIFKKPKNQKWLNGLLHPAVRKFVASWMKTKKGESFPMVVVEVPLLYEKGYYRRFDGVLSISAPAGLRRKRLLRRGWKLPEIIRRENYQWTQRKKDKKADWVIVNKGSIKDLKYAVDRWLETVLGKMSNSPKNDIRPGRAPKI